MYLILKALNECLYFEDFIIENFLLEGREPSINCLELLGFSYSKPYITQKEQGIIDSRDCADRIIISTIAPRIPSTIA